MQVKNSIKTCLFCKYNYNEKLVVKKYFDKLHPYCFLELIVLHLKSSVFSDLNGNLFKEPLFYFLI